MAGSVLSAVLPRELRSSSFRMRVSNWNPLPVRLGSAENVRRLRFEPGVKLAIVQSDAHRVFGRSGGR